MHTPHQRVLTTSLGRVADYRGASVSAKYQHLDSLKYPSWLLRSLIWPTDVALAYRLLISRVWRAAQKDSNASAGLDIRVHKLAWLHDTAFATSIRVSCTALGHDE